MTDCIEWQGPRYPNGYGQVRLPKQRSRGAHRVAYEQAFGPIPEGMVVCHRCDNPPCVNPEHLFVGTQLDNQRDMRAKGRGKRDNAFQASKTHCPQGHPYSPENTYVSPRNTRNCKTCRREHSRRYYSRKKAS